jgi:hypothetical protein
MISNKSLLLRSAFLLVKTLLHESNPTTKKKGILGNIPGPRRYLTRDLAAQLALSLSLITPNKSLTCLLMCAFNTAYDEPRKSVAAPALATTRSM